MIKILIQKKVLPMLQIVFKSKIVTSIYAELCNGYKKIIDDYKNKKWKQFRIDICNYALKVYRIYRVINGLISLTGIILNLFGYPHNSG